MTLARIKGKQRGREKGVFLFTARHDAANGLVSIARGMFRKAMLICDELLTGVVCVVWERVVLVKWER